MISSIWRKVPQLRKENCNSTYPNTRRIVTLAVFLFLAAMQVAHAIPEYSLLTGNRCINCHVNALGGGLRNDLGFYSMEGVSVIKPEWMGLEGIISGVLSTNCAIDRKLFYGMDFRLMSARSAVTPIDAPATERKLFPMQASFQASYHPTSWLFAEGQFNFGRTIYAGQKRWAASLNFQPTVTTPALRLGFFQPSIGFKSDDHTQLVRQQPGPHPKPLIAPYYAEWGAEVRYNAPLWLEVSAAAFSPTSLSEVYTEDSTAVPRSVIRDTKKPLLNARVAFTPRLFDDQLNVTIGASLLSSGDFSMLNGFAGVGWDDKVCVMAEYMMQGNRDARQLRAITTEVMARIFEPVYLYVKVEHGTSENVVKGTNSTVYLDQYVMGTKIMLLPFIELRPEYRVMDSDEYYRTRWMVQMHIYY